MMPADAVFQQALALHRQSRFEAARLLYERALELEPQRAVELTRRALDADPQNGSWT
jgi:tetratricopeptide (TPR) repeat protein